MQKTEKDVRVKFCQMCKEQERVDRQKVFEIDGLVLCDNHTEEYIHSECYPSSSIHAGKFDKLLGRMEFKQ